MIVEVELVVAFTAVLLVRSDYYLVIPSTNFPHR
jgi:hypothetical protein